MKTSENFNTPNLLIIQMRRAGYHRVEAVNTERKELNMAAIMEYVKDSVISKVYSVYVCVALLLLTLRLAAFGERCRTVHRRWVLWKYSGLPSRLS